MNRDLHGCMQGGRVGTCTIHQLEISTADCFGLASHQVNKD